MCSALVEHDDRLDARPAARTTTADRPPDRPTPPPRTARRPPGRCGPGPCSTAAARAAGCPPSATSCCAPTTPPRTGSRSRRARPPRRRWPGKRRPGRPEPARYARALPSHRGWLRIARKPTPWPISWPLFRLRERPAPPARKPSCGARGSTEIRHRAAGRAGASSRAVGRVAVTSTGCLGPCFEGPTIVVYPEAVWYVGVTAADVPEIVEQHMSGGRPVERLRRKDDDDSTA